MDSNNNPRNRGCNSSVRLDLGEFTHRLFTALGAGVQFQGPGPCSVGWLSYHTSVEDRFAIDYLATELFSKFDDGVPSPEKRKKAVRRFIEGETLCSLTNCKFSPLPSGQVPAWLEEDLFLSESYAPEDSHVFRRARQIIGRILGAFPGWEKVLQYADFGPGATTRLPRRKADRSNKWAGRPHATPFFPEPLDVIFDTYPLLRSRIERPGVEIYPGNNLDWVPKNYEIDRTIGLENDWNMFVQKALGGIFRARLRRVGQDLDTQDTNRFLAAIGSIFGDLATLDMSMASDTVAYRLVEYLIRPDWFSALEQCRSPIGFYVDSDGIENAVIYEKFSSMGNGFTFELETLIFYGLLRAVSELCGETDHRLYVYGDDIVVPSGIAEVAMTYLSKAGFIVNQKKSFWNGPFRESCGGHYFAGADVTPFYVREPVDTLDRLFLLHNNVYRWLNRHPGICTRDEVHGILNWIRLHAPRKWQRPRLLSEDVGDGAFIGSFDEVTPQRVSSRKRAQWEGWRAETLQYRVRTTRVEKSQYPLGSGPDLASLWALERKSFDACRVLPIRTAREWLNNISSRDDIDRVWPSPKGQDVPHSERFWYVGDQVLPLDPGDSWWSA